jgi:hypothetical protein
VIKDEVLTKKPLSILEKIGDSLERLNEKMEVMIEIQTNGNVNQKIFQDCLMHHWML